MIRLGRRFNDAGEELTAGLLNREEGGGRLLENLEAGLDGSELAEAAAAVGIGSSSSSLGDTSRSSSRPLPKEFSLFARLSLITGSFSTAGFDFEIPSTSLESFLAVTPTLWSRWSFKLLESLVAGLDLLFSLESFISLRAGLALGLEGLALAGLVNWGLPGLSPRATFMSSSS